MSGTIHPKKTTVAELFTTSAEGLPLAKALILCLAELFLKKQPLVFEYPLGENPQGRFSHLSKKETFSLHVVLELIQLITQIQLNTTSIPFWSLTTCKRFDSQKSLFSLTLEIHF